MAIKKETNMLVADNSGAKEVRVFHIFGSTGKDTAELGDLVKCAVKVATPGQQVKKHDKVVGVIVRTRREYRRNDGSYISFGHNAVVLIKSVDDPTPVGSRVFGPVCRELRSKGKDRYAEILSRASVVL